MHDRLPTILSTGSRLMLLVALASGSAVTGWVACRPGHVETHAATRGARVSTVGTAAALPSLVTHEEISRRLFESGEPEELAGAVHRWIDSPDRPVVAVAAWLGRLPGGGRRDALVAEVAVELSLPERLGLASGTSDPVVRRDLLTSALSNWAAENAADAMAWLESHRDDVVYPAAQAAIVTVMADEHPAQAAALAATAMKPGPERDRAVLGIVQRWVQQDAPAAAGWVGDLPSGSLQSEATGELVRIWAGSDPDGAASWIGQLTKGRLRDAALDSFARQIAPEAPEQAGLWASEISGEPARMACLKSLFSLEPANHE